MNNENNFILHTLNINSLHSHEKDLYEWIYTFKPNFLFISETHISSSGGESFLRKHPNLNKEYSSVWGNPHPESKGFSGVSIIYKKKSFKPTSPPLTILQGYAIGLLGTIKPPAPFPTMEVLLIALYLPFNNDKRKRSFDTLIAKLRNFLPTPIIMGGDFNQSHKQSATTLSKANLNNHLIKEWPKDNRQPIDYFGFITEYDSPPLFLRPSHWKASNITPPYPITNHCSIAAISLITQYSPMFHPQTRRRPFHLRFREWYYNAESDNRKQLSEQLATLFSPKADGIRVLDHWLTIKANIVQTISKFLDQQEVDQKKRHRVLARMRRILIILSTRELNKSQKRNYTKKLLKLRTLKDSLQRPTRIQHKQHQSLLTANMWIPAIMNSLPPVKASTPWYSHIDPTNMKYNWDDHFNNPNIHDPPISPDPTSHLTISNCVPSKKYLKEFLISPPLGKAPGPDQISGEVINILPFDQLVTILQELYTELASQPLPASFLTASIWFIHKGKGEHDDPHAYRPLSLINLDLTILTRWILKQITPDLHKWIPNTQQGFMKDRWTINNVRYAQDLREALRSPSVRRALGVNTNGYLIGFLDFKKAFDTCRWQYLMSSVSKLDPPSPILQFWLPKLYQQHNSNLLGSDLSFTIAQGVRQGDPLSPTIFNIFLQSLTHFLTAEGIPMEIIPKHPNFSQTFNTPLPSLVKFADDVFLNSYLETSLTMIRAIGRWSINSGMFLHPSKCVLLYIDPYDNHRHVIEELRLLSFELLPLNTSDHNLKDKYLGIFLHPAPRIQHLLWRQDINDRITKAFKFIRGISVRRVLPFAHKVYLINTYVGSQLLYSFFILHPPHDLLKDLNGKYIEYLFPNKAPHPPMRLLTDDFEEGGLRLHSPELLAELASSVVTTKLLSKDTPNWVLAPARLHAQLGASKKCPLHPFWIHLPKSLASHDERYAQSAVNLLLKSPYIEPPLPILHPSNLRQQTGLHSPFSLQLLWNVSLPVRFINFFFLAMWTMERAFAHYSTASEASRICLLCKTIALPTFKHWFSCPTLTSALTVWTTIFNRDIYFLDWSELLSWIAEPTEEKDQQSRLSIAVRWCYIRWALYTRFTLYMDRNKLNFNDEIFITTLQYVKAYQFTQDKYTDKLLILTEYLNSEMAWDASARLSAQLQL